MLIRVKVIGEVNNQFCIRLSGCLFTAVEADTHPTIMKISSATQPNPVLRSTQSAVLLIFFMPTNLNNHPHRPLLIALAESIQAQFGPLLRVLQIDKVDNPDVVSSFGITEMPTFVLVKQGVELWRQVGLCAEEVLVSLIRRHLADDASARKRPASCA